MITLRAVGVCCLTPYVLSQGLVFESRPGPLGSARTLVGDGRGGLLLAADDGVHGEELFRLDRSGGALLLDMVPGNVSSYPSVVGHADGRVFLSAAQAAPPNPNRLWSYNTVTAAHSVVSGTLGNPDRMAKTVSGWVLSGTDALHGRELWRTDGTAAGTILLRDLWTGSTSSHPSGLSGNGSIALFTCSLACSGEPWWTDGVNVQLLASLNPPSGSSAGSFTPFAGQWLFVAITNASGSELWRTDGTAAGTSQVLDINPGSNGGVGSGLIPFGNRVVFRGFDGINNGVEPWVSDGTANGTHILMDVAPGGAGSVPVLPDPSMFAAGDGVLLYLDDGTHGLEPWFSDGTAAGTWLLADINPGPGSSIPIPFFSGLQTALAIGMDRSLVFVADTGTTGNEIWITDGTPAGTYALPEILPGNASAEPRDFVRVGPNVFFTADDGMHGRELWAFPTAIARAAVTETVSPPCAAGSAHPQITSQSLPRVGNQAFAIGVTDAPTNAFAVLFASLDVQEQQICGCTFWPQLPALFAATVTSASGSASLPVPIPAQPFLAGAQLWAQWGVVQLGGPVFSLVTPSDALFVQIGK